MRPNERSVLSFGMRALARLLLSRTRVAVEGIERVPSAGPALLVCRHYHHLYDGLALLAELRRPVHFYVALDWVRDGRQRWYMELLCRLADWPVVLRDPVGGNPWGGGYRPTERYAYLRSSLADSVRVLRDGGVLAMFPEGYPAIDPVGDGARTLWPRFEEGYLGIALRARAFGVDVPLIPVGFAYHGTPDRPSAIDVRFGAADRIFSPRERAAVGDRVQSRVRALSGWESPLVVG